VIVLFAMYIVVQAASFLLYVRTKSWCGAYVLRDSVYDQTWLPSQSSSTKPENPLGSSFEASRMWPFSSSFGLVPIFHWCTT
jgi:hypothetical protein